MSDFQCTVCGSETAESKLCPRCNLVLNGRQMLPSGTQLLSGWFELKELIGLGSSGLVYDAVEKESGNPVAIKEIYPVGCQRQGNAVMAAGAAERALTDSCHHAHNEANVLSLFDHPGLLKIHAAFEENNTVYTVMERLTGRTLLELSGTGLTFEQLNQIVADTCDALDVLHREGIIHGDIKPDNLFLSDAGQGLLLDFGAAVYYRSGRSQTKELTAGYAAPEQLGKSRNREGPHTDIYSLCATLYHLLSGQLPPSDAKQRKKQKYKPLMQHNSQVPAQLSAAVEGGLELEADRRPASMEIFSAILGLTDPPWSPPKLVKKWQKETRLRPVKSVDSSADGRVLAVAAHSGSTVFVPTDGSKEPIRLRFSGQLSGLAINSTARRIAAVSEVGKVKLFNAQAEEVAELIETSRIGSVAFSPDDSCLAVGLFDGRILLWDSAGNMTELRGHDTLVRCLCFSPDSQLLVSGSHDGSAVIWSLAEKRELHRLPHPDEVVYTLCFSRHGRLLATSDGTGRVFMWATAHGVKIRTQRLATKPIRGIDFSPDNKLVAAAAESGDVEVFSSGGGRRVARASTDMKWVGLQWSPAALVTVSEIGQLRGWELPAE